MRSARATAVDLDPSDLAQQTHRVADYFNVIKTHEANRVHSGGLAGDPTSASTQATGPAGITEWRINVGAIVAAVGGVVAELAATVDEVIHDTTVLVTAAGQTCWAAVVVKNVAGTITLDTVKGTPAATASAVPPTEGEIQAAIGAGNDWIKMADCEITRTGDTTVTQSQDNTVRPILGLTVDTHFAEFSG